MNSVIYSIYSLQSCILSDSDWLDVELIINFIVAVRGHGGRVVTLLPPTSEAGVWFSARTEVGKLVVACRWSAVYSTEP